ncbi:MAG: hypothetical protein ACI4ED_08720 [Suilimivivens sp.]
MKKGNKLIARLLCFVLVAMTVLGYDSLKAEAADPGSLEIQITNQDSASGTVSYEFLSEDGQSLDGGGSTISSTTSNIPGGTVSIKIKVVPDTNCQVRNYRVYFNGEEMPEASEEAAISESGNVITVDSTKEYQVQVEFILDDTQPGDDSSDSEPSDVISFRLEGDSTSQATAEYLIDGGEKWTTIETGNATVLGSDVEKVKVRVTFDSSMVTVQGNIASDGIITSGTEYEVTEKKEYRIQVDKYVNTVTWAYDDTFGEDGKVEHGKVEIVSAVKDGKTEPWSGLEEGENSNQQDETGGRVAIIPGSTVTVKIVPDYGYQFLAGTLNGQAITAATEMSTFTFTMPSTQLHLSALFTESPDKFNCTAQGVSGASIEGGGNVINSGNLELEVKDSTISADKKQELQSSAAGAGVSVNQWLEVDLKQIVNKGTSDEAWEQDLEELTNKIRITLNVEKGWDATREYVVVREHNGVYEQIPADYHSVAGTLSFESDRFSNYAVGTADNMPVTLASREEKKVETVVEKEASIKEKAPANIVQLPGGEKAVSSIGGIYNVESVEGVAVTTQKKDVYSAAGLSDEEVKAGTNVVLYMSDCLNKKTNQALNDVAVAANKKVVAYLTADMYTITKQGVVSKVRQTVSPVELLIGVPQSARSANRQFSVVCIDPSKNVVTYNDMDTNPNTITVRANVFGNYAVVY